MHVKIRDISSEGTLFEIKMLPKDLDVVEDFVEQESPIFVQGYLYRVNSFILAKLKVTYTLDTNCARCLDPMIIPFTKECEFEIEYRSLDEHIDFAPLIREEIFIGYQPRVLCKQDCLGICPGCGAYLNEEKCDCSREK